MEQLYRNTIYISTPLTVLIQESYWGRRVSKLQRFAKRFLRFVMFVTVAFVELVRALADYVRSHRHPLTAMLARPILGDGQQQSACAQAALPFCDNQTIHFRSDLHFEQRLLA